MEYILKIEDTEEAKSLVAFLRTLKFVKVKDIKSDKSQKAINAEEFRAIIEESEKSSSIPLIEAMEKSSSWKNQKR